MIRSFCIFLLTDSRGHGILAANQIWFFAQLRLQGEWGEKPRESVTVMLPREMSQITSKNLCFCRNRKQFSLEIFGSACCRFWQQALFIPISHRIGSPGVAALQIIRSCPHSFIRIRRSEPLRRGRNSRLPPGFVIFRALSRMAFEPLLSVPLFSRRRWIHPIHRLQKFFCVPYLRLRHRLFLGLSHRLLTGPRPGEAPLGDVGNDIIPQHRAFSPKFYLFFQAVLYPPFVDEMMVLC